MKIKPEITWISYLANGQEEFYPLELLRRKALVLTLIGKWHRAEAIYRSNLNLARNNLPTPELAEELYNLGRLLTFRNEYKPAMELAEEAHGIFHKINFLPGRIKTLGLIGEIYNYQADYQKALEFLGRMKEMAEAAGLLDLKVGSLQKMSVCYYWLGDYDRALDLLEESRRISEKTMSTSFLAGIVHAIGLVLRQRGEYEKSKTSLQESLRLFRMIGDQRSIAMALGSLAGLYSYQQEHGLALELFSRQVEIAEKIGDKYFLACANGDMASVYMEQGQLSKAKEHSFKEKVLSEEIGDGTIIADSHFRLGLISEYQGQDREAGEFYHQALELARKIKSPRFYPQYLYNTARWECRQGHYEKAEGLLSEMERQADLIKGRALEHRFRMLRYLIDYSQDPHTSENGIQAGTGQLSDSLEDCGIVLYILWRRSRKEEHREMALKAFRQLAEKVDYPLYHRIVQELKG